MVHQATHHVEHVDPSRLGAGEVAHHIESRAGRIAERMDGQRDRVARSRLPRGLPTATLVAGEREREFIHALEPPADVPAARIIALSFGPHGDIAAHEVEHVQA
jgi:hypothetical protein